MKEQKITIGFPLRGEWLAPTTPAEKIPSHGTDRMGLRYAFDFLQVNFEGKTKAFHNRSFLLFGSHDPFYLEMTIIRTALCTCALLLFTIGHLRLFFNSKKVG